MKALAAVVVIAAAAAAVFLWMRWNPTPPDIPFADAPSGGPAIDFARLEAQMPLREAERAKLTPRNVQALTQEQVDQIYARLTAGAIPDGAFDGDLFFPAGASRSRFAEIVGGGVDGGLKGFAADVSVAKLEFLGARLWRGKVFDRQGRVLRNRIADLETLDAVLTDAEEGRLDELYDDELGQTLLFPAKLYCGQSLLDGRRESIIIDYAYTDDLPGYLETLDHLVGREGLRIRDEIRMVRPGFYLGRAYIDRVFALNFTLYNEDLAQRGGPAQDDCWTGEQDRTLTAAR